VGWAAVGLLGTPQRFEHRALLMKQKLPSICSLAERAC
jgi:hypothetical protein